MASRGLACVNLSLRGVGTSGGECSWTGEGGEVEDVIAAADYAHDALSAEYVHLLGYSFGATVCGAAIDSRPFIGTYTAIAYPLGSWVCGLFGLGARLLMHGHTRPLKESTRPKLFVLGTKDDFTTVDTLRRFCGRCMEPHEIKVYDDADHFSFVSSPFCEQVTAHVFEFVAKTTNYVRLRFQADQSQGDDHSPKSPSSSSGGGGGGGGGARRSPSSSPNNTRIPSRIPGSLSNLYY